MPFTQEVIEQQQKIERIILYLGALDINVIDFRIDAELGLVQFKISHSLPHTLHLLKSRLAGLSYLDFHTTKNTLNPKTNSQADLIAEMNKIFRPHAYITLELDSLNIILSQLKHKLLNEVVPETMTELQKAYIATLNAQDQKSSVAAFHQLAFLEYSASKSGGSSSDKAKLYCMMATMQQHDNELNALETKIDAKVIVDDLNHHALELALITANKHLVQTSCCFIDEETNSEIQYIIKTKEEQRPYLYRESERDATIAEFKEKLSSLGIDTTKDIKTMVTNKEDAYLIMRHVAAQLLNTLEQTDSGNIESCIELSKKLSNLANMIARLPKKDSSLYLCEVGLHCLNQAEKLKRLDNAFKEESLTSLHAVKGKLEKTQNTISQEEASKRDQAAQAAINNGFKFALAMMPEDMRRKMAAQQDQVTQQMTGFMKSLFSPK